MSASRAALPTAGLLLAVVLPRLLVFPVVTLSPDEMAYALIGQGIWNGQWPYTLAFDHKPVALYLPYAMAVGLLGGTVTSLRALSLVVAAVGYLLCFAVARRTGLTPGPSAAVAALFSLLNLGNEGTAALSEPLVNVYLLVMVLLLLSRRTWFTAAAFGAVMALTVMTNYITAPICLALATWFLWRERRHRLNWVAALATGLATCALLLLPVFLWSDLHDYFRLQLRFLTAYSAPAESVAARAARWQRMMLATVPVAALAAFAAATSREARVPAVRRWALLLLVAVVTVSLNGFYYPHYAILFAVPMVMVLATQVRERPALRRPLAMAVLVTVGVLSTLPGEATTFRTGVRSILAQRTLAPDQSQPDWVNAVALAAITGPGDVVYSPNIEMYYLTATRPAIRFFFPDHHLDPAVTRGLGTSVTEQMAQVVAARPSAVVLGPAYPLTPEAHRTLDPYLDSRCRLFKQTGRTRVYDCR